MNHFSIGRDRIQFLGITRQNNRKLWNYSDFGVLLGKSEGKFAVGDNSRRRSGKIVMASNNCRKSSSVCLKSASRGKSRGKDLQVSFTAITVINIIIIIIIIRALIPYLFICSHSPNMMMKDDMRMEWNDSQLDRNDAHHVNGRCKRLLKNNAWRVEMSFGKPQRFGQH